MNFDIIVSLENGSANKCSTFLQSKENAMSF